MAVNPEGTMNFLKTCLAVLLGFVIATAIYHPKPVKATGGMRVQQVKDGYQMVIGDRIVGFACTSDTCYVATAD
jgi:hypothetical protein